MAFAADVGASWGLFTLGAAALTFSIQLVTGTPFKLSNYQIASLVAAVIWEFVYFAYQWALSGKTIGMAVLGIRVVKTDGSPIGARQAVLRTLALPLSFLILGLGFLGILTNRDRHAPPRPPGRHRGGVLVGRPGGPAALAGQAGPGPAGLSRGACARISAWTRR